MWPGFGLFFMMIQKLKTKNRREKLYLSGDSIVICITAQSTVDCEWLCDGVITLKASKLNVFSCIPTIPEGVSMFGNCLGLIKQK